LDYDYIAYIDEAGDPGLRKVKPLDENGSSEWLVLSAVLVDARNEAEVDTWGHEFVKLCGSHQNKEIHFRKLPENKQIIACQHLATKPVRAFALCSNKKNMKSWVNPYASAVNVTLAGKKPTYCWFYYWLSRILLEKVTDYVYRRSMKDLGRAGRLKIIFSERGGIRYDELEEYYRLLNWHDRKGTQFADRDKITWEVMDKDLLEAHPHNSRAGLLLPDIVASSFFAACDKHDRNKPPNPLSAFKLDSRMTRRTDRLDNNPCGYGVKLMPHVRIANLDADQMRIFKHYGYRER
jgi:hypothetical protein